MMRAYRKRKWASLEVNMTPLVDVVFLLIIFFIMIINFSDVLSEKVTLPKAKQAKENIKKNDLAVTIRSKGDVFLGYTQYSLDELEVALKEKISDPQKQAVLVKGDENTPYRTVQQVMQKIAAVGITRIHFSTRKVGDDFRKEHFDHESAS